MELPSPQSDDSIRQLARWMVRGKVVSAAAVPAHNLKMVFLPLIFGALQGMSDEDLEKIMVFAVHGVDADASRAINGFPIFIELRIWLLADFQQAVNLAKRVQAAEEAILADESGDGIGGTKVSLPQPSA